MAGRSTPAAAPGVPWFPAHPVPAEASELDSLIKELGERHEREHLAGFPEYRDLSEGNHGDRFQRTKEAMAGGAPVIYQGVLRAAYPDSRDLVTGIPDFLIREGDSYRIRDCKLSRGMDESSHPEILRQLQTYGWLFEQVTGRPPAALEAYLGTRQLEETPYSGAEATHDVSLVYKLDQARAHALRQEGVRTYDELLRDFTPDTLATLARTQGSQVRRVGSAAGRILENARALATRAEIMMGELMVMFDLEGVPPQYEELEKVYLWARAKPAGSKVTGAKAAGANSSRARNPGR